MHAIGRPSRAAQSRTQFSARGGFVLTVMLAFVGGCQRDGTMFTNPDLSPAMARGGGSTAVEVTSVSPNTAPTDTVVDVVVNGKGFVRGAAAKWSLNGDTTQVHVLSTTFVNSGQLKARLQIPSSALTGSYDVEVYLVDGKKGVGAEMFLVVQKFQSPVGATFSIPAAGYNLTSSGDASYTDGVCGVLARVFYLAPDYLDGNMQLDNPRTKDRSCGTSPRKLTITYPDNGLTQANTGGMNIGSMGTVTESSGPQDRPMNIGIDGNGARCTRLGFGNNHGGTKVRVTRLNATQWNVASPPGGSTAACVTSSGQTVLIPNFVLNFTVTLQ